MGVLAMLELEGETAALMDASEDLDRRLPAPDGLLVRILAPTPDGIALFQLWESPEARRQGSVILGDLKRQSATVPSGAD